MKPNELKALRKRHGLKLHEFSEILGINERTLRRYEKGEWPIGPTCAQLLKYIVKFGFL